MEKEFITSLTSKEQAKIVFYAFVGAFRDVNVGDPDQTQEDFGQSVRLYGLGADFGISQPDLDLAYSKAESDYR
ncbi:MAG TPA: hypothetical protein VMR51_00540 [Patescibacteria group bacterium]|nr:hypothetical protein [Patescibacteria group bacterium]